MFPNLNSGNHKRTSQATPRYNCVAFANGKNRKWWEAGLIGGMSYWPAGISDTIDGWTKMFSDQGYEITKNSNIEPGIEKIAIYVDPRDMTPSHVAKSDGKEWRSKLGKLQDISHSTLEVLESEAYGIAHIILARTATLKKARTKPQQ